MPHLTIEYSANMAEFDKFPLLMECNRTLEESGQFEESDLKSRAVRLDTFVVGTEPEIRGIVHARLALLSGRAPEIKRDLSQRLLAVLEKHFGRTDGIRVQISVELQDMDRDSFSKVSVSG